MEKKQTSKLEKCLTSYFKDIHAIYTHGNFREESFYPSLKSLLEDCSKLYQNQATANVLVAPRKTEAGIPDFRLGKDGEIIGYIEAKPPDANLEEIEDTD